MKCCSCKEGTKKLWIFGCGVLTLLIALILGLLWPALSLKFLYQELMLKNGSTNFNYWLKTPIPMYMEFYFFNWTNPNEVHNFKNVKPNFAEMGPYVFEERHERVDLEWFDNNTIGFNQIRNWNFVPEMSNGTLDDLVTNLNVIATTISYAMREQHFAVKLFVDFMMHHYKSELHMTKTVRELLFDGYDDPLLDFIRRLNIAQFKIPFDKFGWFADRNGSSTYDGRLSIFTGVDDIKKLGLMDNWNYKNRTDFYRGGCGMINGTTGEVWPPLSKDEDITIYATDICRSISLSYSSEFTKLGIKGNKWIGDNRVLDNGWNYPPASCFCTANEASCPDLMPGLLNVSSCKFGAPAFVSYPHFYLADDSYRADIEGMKPDKDEHQFYIALEPSTGIPLEVRAQLQINLLLNPVSRLKVFENIPKIMVPMFWFRQVADITEELASDAWLALNLHSLGLWIAIGVAGIGGVLIITGIMLTIYKKWDCKSQLDDDDELLS